jgi:uncharacterized protein (TIGR02145 family)
MINRTLLTLIVFTIIHFSLLCQDIEQSQSLRKSALVIGNGNYYSSVLSNPENDARAIEDLLTKLGFIVFKYENLNQSQMKKAIDDFGLNLKRTDVGLFFYAGHGIQANGYNYLIPVDAQLTTERQIEYDCVQADRILALMEGSGTKINIIILDACRNNPFERSWTRSSTGRGLAFMNAAGGTLIAYSTAPGTTAQDGSGNNSPYTTAILESLKTPGLSITQIFQNITKLVSQRTGKQQIPWISSSLTGDFYLNTTGILAPETENQNLTQPIFSEKTVENLSNDVLLDPVENRRYKTVKIGDQIWMAENLIATKLNDGTSIPLITNKNDWGNLTTPGFCWYINQIDNGNLYGALYNWYVINTGKLCPIGWHVPTDAEWITLINYLGGENIAGSKLKEAGIRHWKSKNFDAINGKNYTALPGGSRTRRGTFLGIGKIGSWWSSTEYSLSLAWNCYMANYTSNVFRTPDYKKSAFSVRCIKD